MSCSLHSMLSNTNKNNNDVVELDYPMKNHSTRTSVRGSCNGLVCIAIDNHAIFIWNPSTKESKKLPLLGKISQRKFIVFGFGYDQLNEDYKVVLIIPDDSNGPLDKWVKVYSLKTNSWRKIEDFPHAIPSSGSGKFVNGVPHCAIKGIIVSFDLENETYGEIVQPNYGDGEFDPSLAVLEGCLSISYNFINIFVLIFGL